MKGKRNETIIRDSMIRPRVLSLALVTFVEVVSLLLGSLEAADLDKPTAARIFHGVHASVAYQLYRDKPGSPAKKIDIAMAPVLGAMKYGLTNGLEVPQLLPLHDQAVKHALFIVDNLSKRAGHAHG